MTDATIPVASKAKYNRVLQSKATNPEFVYGPRELVLSYGETALYLSVMGDPISGVAPVNYIKEFFGKSPGSLIDACLKLTFPEEQERLPYDLGWTKPTTETNLITLGGMITQLFAANPEALPEGLSLGEGSLKDVYELIDPVTGKLINSTCVLAGLCL
jgi:hypothetical protein